MVPDLAARALRRRGSVVAIDSAVPRREEGMRTDDDLSASSMVSLSRGLPSVPSIPSMHSPSHHQHPGHHLGGGGHHSGGYLDVPTTTLEVGPCPTRGQLPNQRIIQGLKFPGFRG